MMIYKPDVHKMGKKNDGHRFTMVGVCNHDQTSGQWLSHMEPLVIHEICHVNPKMSGGFTDPLWWIHDHHMANPTNFALAHGYIGYPKIQ